MYVYISHVVTVDRVDEYLNKAVLEGFEPVSMVPIAHVQKHPAIADVVKVLITVRMDRHFDTRNSEEEKLMCIMDYKKRLMPME